MGSLTTQTPQIEKKEPVQNTLNQGIIWLFTIAGGMTVANLYYNQPLLADMAHSFSIWASQAGFLGTLTQLGYALGLLLIVPLGDTRERRGLIVTLLLLVTGALLAVAFSPDLAWIAITSFAVGLTTVIPQVILPFAASLAPAVRRGRVVGTVMSGILIGILLARTLSGFVGAQFGWRTMYVLAAGFMLILAVVLRIVLPKQAPHADAPYLHLLTSLGKFVRTEPALRQASIFGALAFGAFNVFWVTLSFYLQTPPYHYSSAVVGLFGVVGVGGAIAAPLVGKVADRTQQPRLTMGLGMGIALLAFLLFWLLGQTLWGLIIGVILLDLGVQTNLISCQTSIYSLHPEARSRLNTVFMTTYFLGGALGSTLGTYGWSLWRWNGVCVAGAVLLGIAFIVFLATGRYRK